MLWIIRDLGWGRHCATNDCTNEIIFGTKKQVIDRINSEGTVASFSLDENGSRLLTENFTLRTCGGGGLACYSFMDNLQTSFTAQQIDTQWLDFGMRSGWGYSSTEVI